MGFVKDPDGNALILHRRYEQGDGVTRTELLERYRALPMPTTTDESWRFTDLEGLILSPSGNGAGTGAAPASMLDIEAA